MMLCGHQGSGKTTLGKQLAEALGWPFIDLDDQCLQTYNHQHAPLQDIQQCYLSLGESAFRQLEQQVLLELPQKNRVIALGGGSLQCGLPLHWFHQQAQVIYLHQPLNALLQNHLQPWQQERLRTTYALRHLQYQAVADHTLYGHFHLKTLLALVCDQ